MSKRKKMKYTPPSLKVFRIEHIKNKVDAEKKSLYHLWPHISEQIIQKITGNIGLTSFAYNRSKFEGWFKVELCGILLQYYKDITPEKNNIDLSFEDWVIELKTINTNYRFFNVKTKGKPITDNIYSVLKDIQKLKKIPDKKRGVYFIVFPSENNSKWKEHESKIISNFSRYEMKSFLFKNKIPGLLYFGEIKP